MKIVFITLTTPTVRGEKRTRLWASLTLEPLVTSTLFSKCGFLTWSFGRRSTYVQAPVVTT